MITAGEYPLIFGAFIIHPCLHIRTKGGCDAANVVGLKDCQGFVKAGIREPLRFIDVHTSWNQRTKKFDHSEEAQALVDVIDTWGTK